jgi:acetyl esterase/lipase
VLQCTRVALAALRVALAARPAPLATAARLAALALALFLGSATCGASGATAGPAGADANTAQGAPDPTTVHTSAADIPLSNFASPETRQAVAELRAKPAEPNFGADVKALRDFHSQGTDKILADVRALYAATIKSELIGGVRTDVVVPEKGVTPRNRDRVLISLHSGGFLWGAGSESLLEAVPIAVTAGIKVIAVDYRMAPEFTFPSASEDVAAVYRALLKTYKPGNIGIYGCSAGGVLAAQSVAWFATHDLPQPGAIATLCGTGAEFGGDSAYLAPLLSGQPIPPGGKPLLLSGLPYFSGVDAGNPLAFPIVSPRLVAQFPPTLLLAGTRDFAASSETLMQRRLWEAGVDAELILFDGLWHAFMMDPHLPESREVYDILGRFFDRHLGRGLSNGR